MNEHMSDPMNEPMTNPTSEPASGGARRMLAMVVEDDPALCIIFSEAVRRAGFTVESFSEGRAALQRLRQAQPRLLLLDLHLPDIVGTEMLYPIRTDPRQSELVIVLATADPLLADLYSEQADFVLLKPISYTQLRDLAARIARAEEG